MILGVFNGDSFDINSHWKSHQKSLNKIFTSSGSVKLIISCLLSISTLVFSCTRTSSLHALYPICNVYISMFSFRNKKYSPLECTFHSQMSFLRPKSSINKVRNLIFYNKFVICICQIETKSDYLDLSGTVPSHQQCEALVVHSPIRAFSRCE